MVWKHQLVQNTAIQMLGEAREHECVTMFYELEVASSFLGPILGAGIDLESYM